MASGKSTVGRMLAAARNQEFLDLDAVIEQNAGKSIPRIFAEDGEPEFRRLEVEALRASTSSGAVIATGGGTPCQDNAMELMRQSGLVVGLTAPLEVLLQRIEDPSSRPMLDRGDEQLRQLFAEREAAYRGGHCTVATADRPAAEVVSQICDIASAVERVPDSSLHAVSVVGLPGRAYPVVVDSGVLDQCGTWIRRALDPGCQRVAVLSDKNVAPLYLPRVRESLQQAGFEVIDEVVPAGEGAKCIEEFHRVCEALVDGGLDRRSAVIALGGGVVGDLAGFVASSLFRGVAFVQVPTTALAMTDSAIGGKTGINIRAGKNLVGAFWQPQLVLADPDVLQTLPEREWRAAVGELVKYGLLDSESLYEQIESLADAIGTGGDVHAAGLTEVIRQCAEFKCGVVTRDERESSERALLNLGHTVGHAIEAATEYRTFLHGEAVGLGLVAACRVSHGLGLCEASLESRVCDTLVRAGLCVDLDSWLRDDVLMRMKVDKKRQSTGIRFVTLSGVGRPGLRDLSVADIAKFLRR